MRRCCLIPASGFYDWDSQGTPFYFTPRHSPIFALAGLWDTWKGGGRTINSYAIINERAE